MVGRSVSESKNTSHKKMTKKISDSASCVSTSATAAKRQLKKKKDMKLHELIYEEGGLLDGTEVTYDCKLLGYKISRRILCSCCRKMFSPSKFEDHAGMGHRKKPYQHIYLTNQISLDNVAKCLSEIHSAQDDGKCGEDDEKWLLCDECRSFFYEDPASSPFALNLPSNRQCKLCKGKYREQSSDSDVRKQEEVDQCFLCSRSGHDCDFQSGRCTLVACHQCEKEYHMCCLNRKKNSDLEEEPMGKWFCCLDCERISSHLRTVVESQQNEFTDSHLEPERNKLNNTDKIIRWRLLLCGERETSCWHAEAYAILKGCFNSVVDTVSRRDLTRDMFFRKKGKHSVYCAVVTVDSSVVAAGLLRVLGRDIGELPLAATAMGSRGQGYFRQLISGIEDLLKGCLVRKFVLPATEDAESMWINKFGFIKMSDEQYGSYVKNCWNMLEFPKTTMLQKVINDEPCSDLNHQANLSLHH